MIVGRWKLRLRVIFRGTAHLKSAARFQSSTVHVGLAVYKISEGSFHRYSILFFIFKLLLLEGQAGKDWKPSKQCIPLGIFDP